MNFCTVLMVKLVLITNMTEKLTQVVDLNFCLFVIVLVIELVTHFDELLTLFLDFLQETCFGFLYFCLILSCELVYTVSDPLEVVLNGLEDLLATSFFVSVLLVFV